ncbi:MAG: hypothetical protein HY401_00825 [Elusimicrobia bacterium]|nr:hypothetical protein [Elusimicrobiota bacterium]
MKKTFLSTVWISLTPLFYLNATGQSDRLAYQPRPFFEQTQTSGELMDLSATASVPGKKAAAVNPSAVIVPASDTKTVVRPNSKKENIKTFVSFDRNDWLILGLPWEMIGIGLLGAAAGGLVGYLAAGAAVGASGAIGGFLGSAAWPQWPVSTLLGGLAGLLIAGSKGALMGGGAGLVVSLIIWAFAPWAWRHRE